jgi:uncharacterized membrane protein YhaH (DUF805 family)
MVADPLTELWRWLFATSLLAPVLWIYRCSKQLEAFRAVLLGAAFFGVLWWDFLPLLKMVMSGPQPTRFSKALAWGWQQGGGWYKWPGSILLIAATAGAYAGWWRSTVANPPPHMGSSLALRLALAVVPTAAGAWFGYAAFTTGRGDGPVSPAMFFFGIALILAIPSVVLLASAFEALVQWMLLGAGDSPAGRPAHSARAASTPSDSTDIRQRTSMTFTESIQTCFRKYADFTGRASRSEYWWFALFIVLVNMAAGLLVDTASALVALAMVLPYTAASARRLHDTGRSGWWQLAGFIPLIGWAAMIYWCVQDSEGPNAYG